MSNKENPKVAIEVKEGTKIIRLPYIISYKDTIRSTLQRGNKVSIYINDKYYRTFNFVGREVMGVKLDRKEPYIYVYFD